MTKVERVTYRGTRYYIHPSTGEKLPGVTSVLGQLPKSWLRYWAAKLVAETAYDELDILKAFAESGDRDGAVGWLKAAPNRPRDAAAATGTEVHALTEQIDELGGIPRRLSSRLLPFARGYVAFRERFEPVMVESELAVANLELGYAGTLDRVVEIDGGRHVLDLKTSRAVYPEVALQLAAYAAADHRIDGDDMAPWSADVSDIGLVLHLRPDGWSLVPVKAGPEVFEVFRALLSSFAWRGLEKKVLGEALDGESFDEDDVVRFEQLLGQL